MECQHENVEFDPGNHVPPYGWEIRPGLYCLDCGDMVDDGLGEDQDDGDRYRDFTLEDEYMNGVQK